MEQDNKVFHQAKAEMWEQLEMIKSLQQIEQGGCLYSTTRTRVVERINDMTIVAIKELSTSNVYGK